jgi:hypothetical protein
MVSMQARERHANEQFNVMLKGEKDFKRERDEFIAAAQRRFKR